MSCRIQLQNGLEAIVDADDFERLSQFRWRSKRIGNVDYAVCITGRTQAYMHRVILNAGNTYVDHINGNGLDNRRRNLRACSRAENQRNRGKFKGLSKFKGVTVCRRDSAFMARIRVNGDSIFLGRFKQESEAAYAYDRAALKHFGQFSRINFAVGDACMVAQVSEGNPFSTREK